MSRVRWEMYTRKSSEEGLDQEFNSLDAQYEACGLLLDDGTVHKRSLERIRHSNDAKLIVGDRIVSKEPAADPQLISLLNDVRRAQALAMSKPKFTLDRLAKLFGRSTGRNKRLLRLSYLTPSIVSAIIDGKQRHI